MKNLKWLLVLLSVVIVSSCFLFDQPGYVKIRNNTSSYEIWYVYITPSSASSWGNDLLGSSEIIGSYSSRTFEMEPDTYDIWVDIYDYSGGYYGYGTDYGFYLGDGSTVEYTFDGSYFYQSN